jgi:hypothetical protein
MNMKRLLTILFLVACTAAFSQRISELPPASGVETGNLFVIVQDGVTKKLTYEDLVNTLGNDSILVVLLMPTDALFWFELGNDIKNKNSGYVIVDSLFKIYPLPPETHRVGRIPILETNGQFKWGSPSSIGDQIDSSRSATPTPYTTWIRDTITGVLHPAIPGDTVRVPSVFQVGSTFYAPGIGFDFVPSNIMDVLVKNTVTGEIHTYPLNLFGDSLSTSGGGVWRLDTVAGKVYLSDTALKVGIGTLAPRAELEVVGDIISAGNKWTDRGALPSNISWQSICYGDGLFAVIAFSGTTSQVATSPDGINWTARTTIDNDWIGITYGNGLFVAVSDDGTYTDSLIMTSTDGIIWTPHADSNSAKNICYGGGKFVKVNSGSIGNNIGYSTDGINWIMQHFPMNELFDVVYGNGLFVAVAKNDSLITSPDGINWTGRAASSAKDWVGVTYGNGLFVAVANNVSGAMVMTSPDGTTWTGRTPPLNGWYSVAYGAGQFVAVSVWGYVMTSIDGINWTVRPAHSHSWKDICYHDGMFVVIGSGSGGGVMTSGILRNITQNKGNIYQGNTEFTGVVKTNNHIEQQTPDQGFFYFEVTGDDTICGRDTGIPIGTFSVPCTWEQMALSSSAPLGLTDLDSDGFSIDANDTITYSGNNACIKFDVSVTLSSSNSKPYLFCVFNVTDNRILKTPHAIVPDGVQSDYATGASFRCIDQSANTGDEYVILVKDIVGAGAFQLYYFSIHAQVIHY